jgi:RNA polymerase sigma-70 factor (ECF subfamily)
LSTAKTRPDERTEADPAPAPVVHLPGLTSDAAIVRAVRSRLPSGAASLFDRYHAHVRRVLIHVLGPDPEVSDLVQDVFISAIDSIDSLSDAEALKSWLGTIAVFTARARVRHRTRWRILHFLPTDELPDVPTNEVPLEVDEALRATYRVLDKLPADERIAFALRHIDGMELTEVAAASEVSLSTIKRRLGKAQTRFERLARGEPALRDFLHGGTPWQR